MAVPPPPVRLSRARTNRATTATRLRATRNYRESTGKMHPLVRKADATRERLVFVTEALRSLIPDGNFSTHLRAENLDTLARNLGDRKPPARAVERLIDEEQRCESGSGDCGFLIW